MDAHTQSSNGSGSGSEPGAPRIAVLGAGSWGTALAFSLSTHGGHPVTLWARRPEHAEAIRQDGRNTRYLPEAALSDSLKVTSDLAEALHDAWLWVFAVPSQSVREVAQDVFGLLRDDVLVVSVAKGIENDTLATTSEVLRDVLTTQDPERIGVLYGPSHAEEVAAGMPTSVVASFPCKESAVRVQEAFMTNALRVYVNADLIGVEIAGSVKNVMALAAGMGSGLGVGDNATAALVTRGLAEIKRLGSAMGADPLTFAGLAGLGDLVVTCFSRHSRNRKFGEMIGGGMSFQEAEDAMTMVVEGVRTTRSVRELAQRHGIEMPITESVYAILFEGKKPHDAVSELMARDAKSEDWHPVEAKPHVA